MEGDVLNSFKEFVSSHKTIPFKMCVIVYLGWAAISYVDTGGFLWLGAFFTMISMFIGFWLLLIIAAAISFNKNKLPGIFTEDIVIIEARKPIYGLRVMDEYPGVFELSTDAEFKETGSIHKPIANPSSLYYELLSSHRILSALKTYKSEETIQEINPFLNALSRSLGDRVNDSRVREHEGFKPDFSQPKRTNATQQNKFKLSYLLAIIGAIIAFGVFVYPGVYEYTNYGEHPAKINRFTGHTEVYTLNGWMDFGEEETSPAQ